MHHVTIRICVSICIMILFLVPGVTLAMVDVDVSKNTINPNFILTKN